MDSYTSNWISTKIGNIIELVYGQALPERVRSGKGFPVFGSNGIVGYHDQPLTSGETIIIGRKGSIGEINYSQISCSPIDTTYYVDKFYGMPSRFWYYQLSNLDLASLNKATAVPGLNREDVYAIEISLPPLAEQKRIADKLDALLARVDACRAHLNRVPEILNRFRQAVLAAATSGKLLTIQSTDLSDWKYLPLGSILLDIKYGTAKRSSYEQKDGIPVLRIPNVVNGTIDITDLKFGYFDNDEIESLAIKAGDILMIRSNGSVDLVGKTAVVEQDHERYLFAGYLLRLRLDQTVSNPYYISFHLSSPRTREHIERTARSTSGVNNINADEVKAIELNLPPLQKQNEIVKRVQALLTYADRLEARYQAARAHMEGLTPSLLAKAFRGELVPQDPADEPAAALLERIRAAREASAAQPPTESTRRRPRRERNEELMPDRTTVSNTHLTDLLKERGPLTSEKLWAASGLSIEDFYDQLKDEELRGLLRELRNLEDDLVRKIEAL